MDRSIDRAANGAHQHPKIFEAAAEMAAAPLHSEGPREEEPEKASIGWKL
jgi:hypothetical protein